MTKKQNQIKPITKKNFSNQLQKEHISFIPCSIEPAAIVLDFPSSSVQPTSDDLEIQHEARSLPLLKKTWGDTTASHSRSILKKSWVILIEL